MLQILETSVEMQIRFDGFAQATNHREPLELVRRGEEISCQFGKLGRVLYEGTSPHVNDLKVQAALLPEGVAPFVLFDATDCTLTEYLFVLCSLAPLPVIVKGKWTERYPMATPFFSWGSDRAVLGALEGQAKLLSKRLPEALCLCPGMQIEKLDPSWRVILEENLTQEWDGVDRLFVDSQALSVQGRRKVAGFEAAGGVTVNLSDES